MANFRERKVSVAPAEQDAKALFNRANNLRESGLTEEELAAYDEIVRRYGTGPEAALAGLVAKALANKAVTLIEAERLEEAFPVFDEIVRRYEERPESGLTEQVALALLNKGFALRRYVQHLDALEAFTEVVRRYGGQSDPGLGKLVAQALVEKGVLHWEQSLGFAEEVRLCNSLVSFAESAPQASVKRDAALSEALAAFDQVDRNYSHSLDAAMTELVATALVKKSGALSRAGRAEEALATLDEVVSRYGDRSEAPIADQVAVCFIIKGRILQRQGRTKEALAAFDEVVRRYGDRPEAALAEKVATAIAEKGSTMQREAEATLLQGEPDAILKLLELTSGKRQSGDADKPSLVDAPVGSLPALSPGALLEHSRQIYMVYLIRKIFERIGDEGIFLSAEKLARELTQFGWRGVGRTVLNHIQNVEELFQRHFRNSKLKLFEVIPRVGVSIMQSLQWDKDVESAWRLIELVGGRMDALADRKGRVDKR